MRNNILLFVFGTIFLLLGFLSPLINSEFNNPYSEYDDSIYDEVGQSDLTASDSLTFLGAVFFWVFGAPLWLNIIIGMMRVVFWVIVYDKVRGLS